MRAARRGKFTRGVKSDAPATRKNCRRLEHGLMRFLLRLGAERDEKNAMAAEIPRDDCPAHPGQVLCLALIRPMPQGASPAKKIVLPIENWQYHEPFKGRKEDEGRKRDATCSAVSATASVDGSEWPEPTY